ncbi:MAG TPA: response regulator [Ktedonobacterales bacterium]|jgi:two-component system, response regulator PdtaR
MTKRLIIADDETLVRQDLKEDLERLGYTVVRDVPDGTSAINAAREIHPDAVIMDIRMPGVDGVSAAEVLTRERVAPVVLVTGYPDPQVIERARDVGVVSYLTKPWRDEDLQAAVELGCARFQEFRDLEDKVTSLEDQLATRRVVERAKGILMEQYGLSENDAYQRIRRLSMNTRKTMREVADAIILTTELQGNG